MPKQDNQKIPAPDDLRKLAGGLTQARTKRKQWEAAEEQFVQAIKDYADTVDITYVTSHGDEVLSISETAVITRYNYKKYFEDHPAEFAALQAGYITSTGTQVRVTTQWVEEE